MMGQNNGQIKICIIDIGGLAPENHLLKKIDNILILVSYMT